jgi:pimeloyl-ACP methyl ester carboxylesterase
MPGRIYALLVGINDYPPEVGKLSGCLNDVDHFNEYLRTNIDPTSLAVEVLKDSDATRANVIEQFRSHLGRANKDDVALFQFCGHGARWASARAFKEFYPDGKDEGLVCSDSRTSGGFDLADKELAVLVEEVARNDSHVAVILDCCHSGSGTRGVDAFRRLNPRVTHEVATERPLESYLNGYYTDLPELFVPTSKHVLLAACERTQLAQEDVNDKSGIFTSTLLEVLNKSGGDLTYADLFLRCRSVVRSRALNQNPQFETFGHFNSNSGFLGRDASLPARRYVVKHDQGSWKVACGAIQGVPTEPEKTVALALYPENDQARLAGTASTVRVGAQESEVALDFTGDESVRYRAEITSMPVAPMAIFFQGDATSRVALQSELDKDGSVNVMLTDIEAGARYTLCLKDGYLQLKQSEMDILVQQAEVTDNSLEVAASSLLPVLKHVSQWERGLALQNPGTQMDSVLVDFHFSELLDNGEEYPYKENRIVLDYAKDESGWNDIGGKIKARNRTQQRLHLLLVYYSTAYGIHILKNDPIEPGEDFVTLWGDDPKDTFFLDEGDNESRENFKLIVSTEKVDDFLLALEEIKLGETIAPTRAIRSITPTKKMSHRNEWFTKDIEIRLVRRLDLVGATDTALAGDRLVVKGHPSFTANLSMGAAKSATRSAGDGTDFYKAFEPYGIEMLNFAGARGGNESVLELTDIQSAETLKTKPLEIQLHVPLQENEGILPLVYDGKHVLLGGDPFRDEDGVTHISISEIPEVADNRRSVGGSLKLYFFKTYLKQTNVNLMRWVDFKHDGSFEHQSGKVAAKVAAAKNILLLVHGIIGDTESMARGVKACELNKKFDLVLTYDYENLSTPIEKTARQLKSDLAEIGLNENDNKVLTVLSHSMGGLVSRWFIEREYGNKVVDHLVMCGTPNNGSPFGQINGARKILSVLTSLSMNFVPAFIPFSTPLLMLLNRSKKLTPTLEQIDPDSDFIRTLNQSEDPGISYTILAGDIEAYTEPSDRFFANLLDKAGKGFVFETLFKGQPNDIAVGVDSILDITGERRSQPVNIEVACHHLNYFDSENGQQALLSVSWPAIREEA